MLLRLLKNSQADSIFSSISWSTAYHHCCCVNFEFLKGKCACWFIKVCNAQPLLVATISFGVCAFVMNL